MSDSDNDQGLGLFSVELYQEGASSTAKSDYSDLLEGSDEEIQKLLEMLNWAIGLAGEAGEFADLIKKKVFHGHDVSQEEIESELGDITWYTSANCDVHDLTLEDVMKNNLEKLDNRYSDGFDKEESQNRGES